jgi:hypothetical protein
LFLYFVGAEHVLPSFCIDFFDLDNKLEVKNGGLNGGLNGGYFLL